MIVIKTTASYMPKNNILEYSSIIEEQFENVTASFCYCFTKNKQIILANNRKRGLEIAGGHVEKGETPIGAASRENKEETGYTVTNLKYFLTAKHTCLFDKPDNYKYPYPISYMNFYTTNKCSQENFTETEECKLPEVIDYVEHEAGITLLPSKKQENMVYEFLSKNPHFNIFAKIALGKCK